MSEPETQGAVTPTLERARKLVKVTAPWRYTGMGGRDEPFAVCPTCLKIFPGDKRITGRTHGKVIFLHEHPLTVINLYQSNRGNRRVGFENFELLPEEMRRDIVDLVKFLWVDEYRDDDEVYDEVRKYLAALRIARKMAKSSEEAEVENK